MGRMAKDSGGGDFAQAPVGNHVARCYRIIDLGTQHSEYQGQPVTRSQILISWELCNEKMDNGEPFIVSEFYTNSLSEKSKLRPALEAWRGVPFTEADLKGWDLAKIIGAPCMLNVIHNENKKARVASIAPMPKGVKAPAMSNPQFAFWLDEYDEETFQAIPEGIRNIIAKSDEYKDLKSGVMKGKDDPMTGIQDMESDIPF